MAKKRHGEPSVKARHGSPWGISIRKTVKMNRKIHIYFNSPLQTGPDEGQGLSVCDRETTIPAHIQNSYELRRKNIRLTITI